MQRENWYGTHKLTEETGGLLQVLGKLGAFPEGGKHPDGGPPLHTRLEDEIADVLGAIGYFVETNHLDQDAIAQRAEEKRMKFHQWGLYGLRYDDETQD